VEKNMTKLTDCNYAFFSYFISKWYIQDGFLALLTFTSSSQFPPSILDVIKNDRIKRL